MTLARCYHVVFEGPHCARGGLVVSLYPQKLVESEAAVSWRVEAEDGLLPTEDLVPVSSSGLSLEPFNRPVGSRYTMLTFTPNSPTLHHSCMHRENAPITITLGQFCPHLLAKAAG